MKKNNFCIIFIGSVICTIIMLSSLYVLFKSGVSAVIDTVLLSMLGLSLFKKISSENTLLTDIFARASLSAVTTIAVYYAVFYLFGESISLIKSVLFTFVIIVSGILGVLFFSTLKNSILDNNKYSFPMLKPRVEMIKAVECDNEKGKKIIKATLFGAAYSFITRGIHIIPSSLKINNMFVFDNSLVLVATGYFIGYKTYAKMLIGFSYSLIIYFIFKEDSFSEHILNSYIYSIVLGFSFTQGFLTVKKMIMNMKQNSKGKLNSMIKNNKSIQYIIILFAFYAVGLGVIFQSFLNVPYWIFIILIPLSLMLSTSTLIGVAETGFWISALEDILPIFIILLTQTNDLYSIVLIVSGLTAFEMCGIYYILNVQVAKPFSIIENKIKQYSIASIILGSILCMFFISLMGAYFGFGSVDFPAPLSQVFYMTVTGLMDAVSTVQIPSYINVYILIIASLLCIVLNKVKISPMIILSGIMLPFGSFLVIGVGAILSYILCENKKFDLTTFSGLSIGDGLVSTIIALVLGL